MKKNLSQIKYYSKKPKNIIITKSTLSQSISSKSFSTFSSIVINSEGISNFNLESLIAIENAIFYFFNSKIKPESNSFIDFFKTIRYFKFNTLLKKLFQSKDKSSNNLEIIENFLNLLFLSILFKGILLQTYKENIKLKNMINNCISSSYQSFLLLIQIIINELHKYSFTNFYMNRLTHIILKKSTVRVGNQSKEILSKIDMKNKEIFLTLKNILNTNKSMIKLRKGLSPLPLVLKVIYKISSDWTIDYCFKVLGLDDSKIKEIKGATYVDLKENSTPLYLPIKSPFLDKIIENSYILTVVLDLDETIIRYNI